VKELELKCCLNLRVLKLVDVSLEMEVLDVSSLLHLKSLEVDLYSSSVQIFGLGCLRNLVFLSLRDVQEQMPNEGIEGLTSLNALVLSCSRERVEKLPDLSRLNLLQYAIFAGLGKADTISGLSSRMTNLKRLKLVGCKMLRSCNGVGELLALEELYLLGCKALEELPNLGRLTNLLELNISFCALIEAVPGLSDLVSLQLFEASYCVRLAELPDMHKLVNLQDLWLRSCPFIQTIPGLSDLIALKRLAAPCQVFEGISHLRKLTELEDLELEEWSAQGCLPCMSGLVNLKRLWIDGSARVDEFAGLLTLRCNLQNLEIHGCGFKDVQFWSNTPTLTSLHVSECDQLERLRGLDKLTGLEELEIENCGSLRDWNSGSGLKLFGADLNASQGTFLQLHTLDLEKVAFTELPDLSSFPKLKVLCLSECGELTSLTSSAPSTALETLYLVRCRNLRALPDLSHLVSLRRFQLEDCGVQLTQHEIEKMNALCPGLELELDDPPVTELERDAKRLRS
jgi:Leucine-rich repeat (LRR) protein